MLNKKSVVFTALLYLLGAICIAPLVVIIYRSFIDFSGRLSASQYLVLFLQSEVFFIGFWNAFIYTLLILIFNIPLSIMSAYAFTHWRSKFKKPLFLMYIVLMLMPFQATLVPQYLMLKSLGIIHTPYAVIVPNIFATFGTFLLAQYMKGFNQSIYEAARIDGLNSFYIFFKIALPICKSMIVALSLLLLINYWSMIEQPLVFLEALSQMPLAVTISEVRAFDEIFYSAGVLFSVVPLLLYQYAHRDLLQGIALSSVRATHHDNGQVGHYRRKKALYIFLVIMLCFSSISQKVSYAMMPFVEVAEPTSGTLNLQSNHAAHYQTIIPTRAVYASQGEHYVFLIAPDKMFAGRHQSLQVAVTVLATDGVYTAISGALMPDSRVITLSEKKLRHGMYVKRQQGDN